MAVGLLPLGELEGTGYRPLPLGEVLETNPTPAAAMGNFEL